VNFIGGNMEKITIKINYDTEMYGIYCGENCISYGNFWDFNLPGDFRGLFESIGFEVEEIETSDV
jgi:hypothetical protein